MSEVYILFGASVAVAFFAIVTFFVVVSYHKALKRQRELESELEKIKAMGTEASRAIISAAQIKANEIITSSQIKGQEIIKASDLFSEDFKSSFQSKLTQELSGVSQTINSEVEVEMQKFRSTVTAETGKVKDSLSAGMKVAYERAQEEVNRYKQEMMARVNQAIFGIVEDAAKKSLGASLTRDQHEKVILKALEEAKKQNVF